MQQYSEALLASLPEGGNEQVPVNAAGLGWEEVRQEASRGNIIWITADRYCTVGDGVDSLKGYLHGIWHVYYQAGRYLSHESPGHDAIVLDILRIQGKGPLSRPVRGALGVGLPFSVLDMVEFWINGFVTMSGTQRLNLSSFAKVASTRDYMDGLCQIAPFLFRATLENENRDLRSVNESDAEDPIRAMNRLSMIKEAKQGGDNKLAEDVADAIDRMMYHAEELNSHVLRVYESGGPALHEDRHLLCLKKLL
ncbi:hypothetical protein ASPNIDRAFT_141870, partial [Aspergillus niger ATCC 1015]